MELRSLLKKMAGLVEIAAKRLWGRRAAGVRLLSDGAVEAKRKRRKSFAKKEMPKARDQEEVEDDEVWRRTIMMGEKCQPLEFSGVIYYDADGQRVPAAPRSPLRRPLPSSSSFF
ncbi:hypothetical protein AXF42_Ash020320 [Apostasia shenzhenica]|uniref:Uncharacterized protein n=1 Tax=Apostasia shenzhenica TaxID=1088818 RepID=A0A2I0B0N3_9ASPA|nr:hypothetical protein AXF42_Ash020320 [Apostasia shenzhenica]